MSIQKDTTYSYTFQNGHRYMENWTINATKSIGFCVCVFDCVNLFFPLSILFAVHESCVNVEMFESI